MKREATISLSLALAFCALVFPRVARATEAHTNQAARPATMRVSAKQEAQLMVPATVDLKGTLDAKKLHADDSFQAVLQRNVQLKNGPKLENGTVLLGTITADQMQPGNARFALRFTRARLKNGQTIPIEAMIVEVAPSEKSNRDDIAGRSGLWSPKTLRIDEIGAVSGFDMHSAVASRNSAVFVSKKKNNLRLGAGSQLVLALAERAPGQSAMRGGA